MNKDEREKKNVLQAGDIARAQKNQLFHAEEQTMQMHQVLEETMEQGRHQDTALTQMLVQMDQMGTNMDGSSVFHSIDESEAYEAVAVQANVEMTQIIPLLKESSWEEYISSVEWYAHLENLDLTRDPYLSLMSKGQQDEFARMVQADYYEHKANCDKWDYAFSAFCGVITGFIDVFFVGMPSQSKLGNWTDEQADQFVQNISQKLWDKDEPVRNKIQKMNISKDEKDKLLKEAGIPYNQNKTIRPEGRQQCIQYLEKKFGVNYDARYASDLRDGDKKLNVNPDNEKLSTSNHHLKSLAHSPDLIGLFFSVLDQFTSKTTIVDNGKLIRLEIAPDKGKKNPLDAFELRGGNFIAKLFCGVVNWIGHILSDLAGSNSSQGRGAGVPILGYELFQFLNINIKNVNLEDSSKSTITIAELSVKVFTEGYDARFGAAMAIPVALNHFLVRFFFALKRCFYHKLPINQCIPVDLKLIQHQPELRRMLLTAYGVLCVIDAGDAAATYFIDGGNIVTAALHLNFFAYIRLAQYGLAELRARHRQNYIDIKAITKRTREEWETLFIEAQDWAPAELNEGQKKEMPQLK